MDHFEVQHIGHPLKRQTNITTEISLYSMYLSIATTWEVTCIYKSLLSNFGSQWLFWLKSLHFIRIPTSPYHSHIFHDFAPSFFEGPRKPKCRCCNCCETMQSALKDIHPSLLSCQSQAGNRQLGRWSFRYISSCQDEFGFPFLKKGGIFHWENPCSQLLSELENKRDRNTQTKPRCWC